MSLRTFMALGLTIALAAEPGPAPVPTSPSPSPAPMPTPSTPAPAAASSKTKTAAKPSPAPTPMSTLAQTTPGPMLVPSPATTSETAPASEKALADAPVAAPASQKKKPLLRTAWVNAGKALKRMPWRTKVGIAVGSVAGAAAVAGGIAGIVKSSDTSPQTPVQRATSIAQVNHAPTPKVVEIRIPVKVEVSAAPAPTPVAVSILYDNDGNQEPPAATLADQAMFMGVTGCLLLIGCLFLSASGLVYYKGRRREQNRASQIHSMVDSEYGETVSEDEGDSEWLA